jgi:hypothetical protein
MRSECSFIIRMTVAGKSMRLKNPRAHGLRWDFLTEITEICLTRKPDLNPDFVRQLGNVGFYEPAQSQR